MSKRKHEEDLEDQISRIQNQATRIKVSRLKVRFDNGVQQLTAQLKLARGFDRQKMTRRMKDTASDKAKLERLQAEIEVLKKLHEGKVARNYLLKQCVRTKRIAEAEAFRALFGEDASAKVKPSTSVAEGNVFGRLFKSNPVSEVLPGIMKGIREVIGADKATNTESRNSKRTKLEISTEAEAEAEFEGFSDNSPQVEAALGLTSNSPMTQDDEVEDIAAFDSRLAGSSDDESNNEEPRGQTHDSDLDSMEVTSDEDDLISNEESRSDDDLSQNELRIQPRKITPATTTINSTSFLPSLMHGGYYSGSDSDVEDIANGYDPDKAYAAAAAQPRKNRRGQRERQAIAAKKYGGSARHLLKAKGAEGVHGDRQRLIADEGVGRNDGWDARRGAIDSRTKGSGTFKKEGKNSTKLERGPNRAERRSGLAKEQHMGSAAKPRGSKVEPAKSEKMHPSWEAARKRKLEIASAGTASFAGKKITFD